MDRHASRVASITVLVALLLGGAHAACAAPVAYTITGVATGDAEGTFPLTFFSNASFSITASGNTAAVTVVAPGVYCDDVQNVTVVIAGVGTIALANTSVIVVDSTNGTWEIDSSGGTCADLHISDAALGDVDPSLISYHLDVSTGPSAGTAPFGETIGNGEDVGFANFNPIAGVLTFEAVVAAAPPPQAAVATPTLDPRMLAALALLVAGGAWLSGRPGRRRGPATRD